ncbi:MAG: ABC transporter ATP-binding protein [Parcubacteria group bacterium]|nr:ABC transporter ATP-binding protein [Parcubacteria group bacterium]
MPKRAIYLVVAKTRYQLAATFMRFQEHHESPHFRGKTFGTEEYMDWYAKKRGNFTYFLDWKGFNIPSSALAPFYAGRFDPLWEKERKLLGLFRDVKRNFYVIGVSDEVERKNPALKHEFVHALFYLENAYRREVCGVLRRMAIAEIRKALERKGYSSAVFDDEANAFILSGFRDLKTNTSTKEFALLRAKLCAVFRKHFGYSIERLTRREIRRQINVVRLSPLP